MYDNVKDKWYYEAYLILMESCYTQRWERKTERVKGHSK